MAELAFAYGKGIAKVQVPEGLHRRSCLLVARAPTATMATHLFRRALEGTAWRPSSPVAVVVPDETRPLDRAAAFEALAPLLDHSEVRVVVGAGLHPAEPVAAPWPVEVHDARAKDLAEAGVGLRIAPAVAAAASVIVVSCVIPHYLAGFSGGAKGLVPGVADEATILAVHLEADRGAGAFRAAIDRRVRQIEADLFGLNLLVGPRGPFDATAGSLAGAHAEALRRYEAACAQARPEPADVVLADAGGHPVDATLLQAHKAYAAAARLCRPGGTIILVAACDGGFGHPEFERRLAGGGDGFHPYARTADRWREKTRAHVTLMVTELEVAGLGVERVTLSDAVSRIAPSDRVLVAHSPHELLFR